MCFGITVSGLFIDHGYIDSNALQFESIIPRHLEVVVEAILTYAYLCFKSSLFPPFLMQPVSIRLHRDGPHWQQRKIDAFRVVVCQCFCPLDFFRSSCCLFANTNNLHYSGEYIRCGLQHQVASR